MNYKPITNYKYYLNILALIIWLVLLFVNDIDGKMRVMLIVMTLIVVIELYETESLGVL